MHGCDWALRPDLHSANAENAFDGNRTRQQYDYARTQRHAIERHRWKTFSSAEGMGRKKNRAEVRRERKSEISPALLRTLLN